MPVMVLSLQHPLALLLAFVEKVSRNETVAL